MLPGFSSESPSSGPQGNAKGDRMDEDQTLSLEAGVAYMGKGRDFVGQHFWAGGYFASTAGRDEAQSSKATSASRRPRTDTSSS